MVRMPPVHDANGSRSWAARSFRLLTKQPAGMQRLSVLSLSARALVLTAQTGAMALLVALISILIYVGFRFEWRLAAGVVIARRTTW